LSDDIEQILAALADPARLRTIRLLRKKPLRSSDIADALSLSRPLASRHLRVLRRAGVVEEMAEGDDARVRIYRLRAEPFRELRSWLEDVESFWKEQLGAFQAHVESKLGKKEGVTSSYVKERVGSDADRRRDLAANRERRARGEGVRTTRSSRRASSQGSPK
jgi:DNA-binding transcriptional ArsR family regulator